MKQAKKAIAFAAALAIAMQLGGTLASAGTLKLTPSDDAGTRATRGKAEEAIVTDTNHGSSTTLTAKLPVTGSGANKVVHRIDTIETMNAKTGDGTYVYPSDLPAWGGSHISYLKFPLADLTGAVSSAEDIEEVKLQLYFLYQGDAGKWTENNQYKDKMIDKDNLPGAWISFYDTRIHLVDNDWEEDTVTYATHPLWLQLDAAEPVKCDWREEHYMDFDVTEAVKAAYEKGETEISFAVSYENDIGNDYASPIAFASKEAGADKAPQLAITYTDKAPAENSISADAVDAIVNSDGTGTIRFITKAEQLTGEIESFGTYILPLQVFDSTKNWNLQATVTFDEQTIKEGDTFAADLTGVPQERLGDAIMAQSFMTIKGVENALQCSFDPISVDNAAQQ